MCNLIINVTRYVTWCVTLFLNFMNGLTTWENLFWAVIWSSIVGRYCRNWHGPAKLCPDGLLTFKPIAIINSCYSLGLQSILLYNCSWTQVVGCGHLHCQAINSLCDKRFDNFQCAQLLQTDHEYCTSLQISISSVTGIQTLMYTCKRCVKSHSHEFFDCLDHEFLNQENFCWSYALTNDHSGKFVHREINPLYIIEWSNYRNIW